MTREEAIEVYNGLLNQKIKEAFEFFVPELRESEDERIKKIITDSVFYQYGAGVEYKGVLDYLDKLEKQKEQKPVEIDEDVELGLDRALQIVEKAKGNLQGYQTDDGIYECDHAIGTLKHILKRGIKQKPAEWSEEDERIRKELIEFLDGVWHLGKNANFDKWGKADCAKWIAWVKKQKEQKPSGWSEEDETQRQSLITLLKALKYSFTLDSKKAIAWLESFPQRFNLQPKTERGDEDIEKNLIAYLRYERKSTSQEIEEKFIPYIKRIKIMEQESVSPMSYGSLDEAMQEAGRRFDLPCTDEDKYSVADVFYAGVRAERESKQEWSEDDEKIAKEIEEELWYPGDFPDYPSKEESELYDDCQRRLNWFKNKLKSLRTQPKQEWSEEDRLHYANILEALEYVKGCKSDYDKIEAVKSDIAWFKSFRLQKLDASKLENFDPVEVLNRIKTEWPMAWEKVVGKQEWSEENKMDIELLIALLRGKVNLIEILDSRKESIINFLKSLPQRFSLQPKQEWSEEDEKEIDNIIDFLNSPSTAKLCPTLRKNAISFLKSLPERFNLQPKQEWSDRDKEILEFVLGLLDNLVWRRDWEISQAECLEWLVEALKPSWKPSEEQLNYVNWAYSNAVVENDTKAIEVLGELHGTPLNLM